MIFGWSITTSKMWNDKSRPTLIFSLSVPWINGRLLCWWCSCGGGGRYLFYRQQKHPPKITLELRGVMLARSLADRKKWQQVVVTHGVCLEFIKKKNWISKNLYIIGPEVGLVFSRFSFLKKEKINIRPPGSFESFETTFTKYCTYISFLFVSKYYIVST